MPKLAGRIAASQVASGIRHTFPIGTWRHQKEVKPPRSPLPSSCAVRKTDFLGPRPTQPVPAPPAHHLRETKHHHHHQRNSSKSVTQLEWGPPPPSPPLLAPSRKRGHKHDHPEKSTAKGAKTNQIPIPGARPSIRAHGQRGPSPQADRDTGAPWTPPAELCFHCSSCVVKQEAPGGAALVPCTTSHICTRIV